MTVDGEMLRRRLYRPGAAEDDVAAYLAAAPPAAPAAAGRGAAGPAGRRRIRGRLLGGGAVLLALAGAPLIGHVLPPAGRASAAASAAVASPAPAPLPTSSVDPATRAAFVRKIDLDGDAGLAPWWDGTSGAVELHGVGSTTVRLPVDGGRRSGHLTVLLVLGTDGTATWSAARFVIHDDRTIHLAPVAGASGALRGGIPTAARVDYSAATRPQRVILHVPADTPWGLAVVDSVDTRPQLPDS